MKVKGTPKNIGGKIWLFPLLLLLLLGAAIVLPFDYIKYRKTRYYHDTHKRYSAFCASTFYIKLYDLIKKEDLPIRYYPSDRASVTGYGYFVCKDTLIIGDFEPLCFDETENDWVVEIEDEYRNIETAVKEEIDDCNAFLQDTVCRKAAVLIDRDVYDGHPDKTYELFDFYPTERKDMTAALRQIIDHQ